MKVVMQVTRTVSSTTYEIINRPFTPREIMEASSKLENNKSEGGGGSDQIINEFPKHSRHEFALYYTRIINLTLESGHMPDDWCQSVIRPTELFLESFSQGA